jgi:hypothetical protein
VRKIQRSIDSNLNDLFERCGCIGRSITWARAATRQTVMPANNQLPSPMMASTLLSVSIAPSAGFVVKSSALEAGVYQSVKNEAIIPVPFGLKIFVNVAWAVEVPPPAEGIQDVAQGALQAGVTTNGDAPVVPVVVSDGRSVTDKGARFFPYTKHSICMLRRSYEGI